MHRITILIGSALCLFLTASLATINGQSEPPRKTKCPTVKVKGPTKSKGAKTISYKAQINNFAPGARPIFNWSVVGGYIVEGEGLHLIRVQPLDGEIRTTLIIENIPAGCPTNSDSIVTEITDFPTMHPPPIVSSIVTSVSLITRPCPPGTRSETCTPSVSEVQLTANAVSHHFDVMLYTWSVTAGRLKGEGKTITWDLSGVASGTHTVMVEVGYFGLKAGGSATVTVADCADCKVSGVEMTVPLPFRDATIPSELPLPTRGTLHVLRRPAGTLR
jgi:hypothetical protein